MITYRIAACETNSMHVIHSPVDFYRSDVSTADGLSLIDAVLKMEVDSVFGLTFTMPPTNVVYDSITPYNRVIDVYRDIDGTEERLFRGRIISVEVDSENNKTATCEGLMATLNDCYLTPLWRTYSTITAVINAIKSRCTSFGSFDQWSAGTITVDPGHSSYILYNEENCTAMALLDSLKEAYGGYFIPDYSADDDDNLIYFKVNYLAAATEESSQRIERGINLINIDTEFDGTEMYNCIEPLGKNGLKCYGYSSQLTPDISMHDYMLWSASGYTKMGTWVSKTVTFPDIVYTDGVRDAGLAALQKAINPTRKTTITAADMSAISGCAPFQLFTLVDVISEPHEDAHDFGSDDFIITKLEIDMLHPAKNTVQVGDQQETLTEMVEEAEKTGSGGVSSGYKMFTGSGTINADSYTTFSYSDAGFTSVPVVLMTYSTSGSSVSGSPGAIKVYQKTTTQFYASIGGSWSGSVAVDWVAIGS